MPTETVDPRYTDVDRWPTLSVVETMLEGQLAAIAALKDQTGAIAAAAEAAAARMHQGGRLVYAGAGTSGRLAVQDGVELTPTYNWPSDRLVFLVAGGMGALMRSVEGAEDNVVAAREEVAVADVGPNDVLIAVAASGRTPYAVAALEAARGRGALTTAIANNPGTPLLAAADHPIVADTGAEIVAGSTRMKAGTAQKAALNMLSTAIMLRCGLVHRGLMVNMRISNEKLFQRARRMVATLAGIDEARAADALELAGNDLRRAVLIARGVSPQEAVERLASAGGNLGDALATLGQAEAE
ncbi:N-acetylmuramic acid 6-phosphate etherase [Sphingomonas asaccharolytica]|uniref:N-acetylmuramic acid 6-phosphate etherase n=1 Tax=Sphingomonas asaccharolytica TaxID=40681 RepID=UPI00082E06DA|nr:N-acetylmuramic acid 6-phosphate etherase [Sphingomonas asaccharolytica]